MAHDATPGSNIPQEVIDNAKGDIVGTISKYIDLKKAGKDHASLCPFHSERTPSFTVSESKGIYQCFGCGAHGDAIDFVMEHEGLPFHEAVQAIVGNIHASGATPAKRQVERQQTVEEWKPVTPVPDSAGAPMEVFNRRRGDDWEKLTASRRWAYRDAAGNLIGYVSRFELPGGGKDLIPQSFCINTQTGEMRWKWLSFAKPRPIYGLEKLAKHPNAQVIVVEGEKACDKAQERYEAAGISRDKLIVVSWPGGGKAVKHVDWSPLAGRNVGLWPDADQKAYVDTHPRAGEQMPFIEQTGTVCMVEIAAKLDGVANAIKFIMPPAGVPDGWDLADDLPDGFSLLAHTKASAMPMAEFLECHRPKEEPQDVPPWEGPASFEQLAEQMAPEVANEDQAIPQDELDDVDHLVKNKYFTILGHEHENYYIFVHSKQQVIERTAASFGDVGLIQLANDINWWEMNFPSGGKSGGINTKAAASWIDAVASSRGVYDPTTVRGRGAWLDDGRSVYHLGDKLIVDSQEMDLSAISSAHVYTRNKRMTRPNKIAMTKEEGVRVLDISRQVRWSMEGSAVLITGWVFLAPICGALKWRPHIWVTGAAGSGKTTVMHDFCFSLTRGISLPSQGDSTEAGIRQKLSSDALPVLIDEFETNDEREKARVDGVIAMIRKASSETEAETYKGTSAGDGVSFKVRSMFCLASINTKLDKQADKDRITKLTIRVPPKDGSQIVHWQKLEADLYSLRDDETIPARLMARSISMVPIALASIKVFVKAAADFFKSQRTGDQYGTLIAGCWCMTHDHVPNDQEALDLIKSYNWDEHTEDKDQDDAREALNSVMGAKIRLAGSAGDITVYELVREAQEIRNQGEVERNEAIKQLKRVGILVDEKSGYILFGNTVKALRDLVKNTPYSSDLRGQLLRIPGSTRWNNKNERFFSDVCKCVAIPVKYVFDDAIGNGSPPPSAAAAGQIPDDYPI